VFELAGPGKRGRIYRQLFALGNASVLALAQALTCSDRNLRLNTELALGELAGPPWEQNGHYRPKYSIRISAKNPSQWVERC